MDEIYVKQLRTKKGKIYNLKTKKVTVTELLPFLKKEEVLKLCMQCPNFDMLWSCPPSVPDFEKIATEYKYVDVLLFWAETSQFSEEENPAIACYEFLKKQNRKYVLQLEKEKAGRAVFSFSCDLCSECRKREGEPCKKPKKMRFNITAFGFMTEDLASVLMNHQVSWSKDGKEAQYITQVSFLLYV